MSKRSDLIGYLGFSLAIMQETMMQPVHVYDKKVKPVSFNPDDVNRPIPSPPKDLKKFEVDGKEIWALNLKNAIRKSKKQK